MQKDQDIQIGNDFGQKQKVCVWWGGVGRLNRLIGSQPFPFLNVPSMVKLQHKQ